MLNAKGRPDITLFNADGLHMNSRGYEVWKNEILKNADKFLIK